MAVPEPLRQAVINRAGNRCEYCLLSQFAQEAAFHIDHITPKSAGGPSTLENLALACVTCSLKKGARQAANDPATGLPTPLFHPRKDNWADHFHLAGVAIVGLSSCGRATVEALNMNRPRILATRQEEQWRGRFPPGRR